MPELTDDQIRTIRRAREVLAEEHGWEPGDLAARIGALTWHLGDLLALVDQLTRGAVHEEEEPFCATCGTTIGIFIEHGDGWHHFRGNGTEQNPNVLYDAGHEPVVAWRENLSKKVLTFFFYLLTIERAFDILKG